MAPIPVRLALRRTCPVPVDVLPVPLLPIHVPRPIFITVPFVVILMVPVVVPLVMMVIAVMMLIPVAILGVQVDRNSESHAE